MGQAFYVSEARRWRRADAEAIGPQAIVPTASVHIFSGSRPDAAIEFTQTDGDASPGGEA